MISFKRKLCHLAWYYYAFQALAQLMKLTQNVFFLGGKPADGSDDDILLLLGSIIATSNEANASIQRQKSPWNTAKHPKDITESSCAASNEDRQHSHKIRSQDQKVSPITSQ